MRLVTLIFNFEEVLNVEFTRGIKLGVIHPRPSILNGKMCAASVLTSYKEFSHVPGAVEMATQ